ncbi:MAG: hypothetical protein KZQ76_13970 [Candidatus Thiodiazotropha sp. (ex Epidulcina cf. delphinae)]|nr:hypothetical protein [Candidatus Thiodiazotropha sp. (ex Epidulcina cf. delphinae)]
MAAIGRFGALEGHPMPGDGNAFQAELVMGEGGAQIVYSLLGGSLGRGPAAEVVGAIARSPPILWKNVSLALFGSRWRASTQPLFMTEKNGLFLNSC